MNNNQSLPTIAELANRTKVSTTQVCLRIKDSTKEFFEKQAEFYSQANSESNGANKISANSLMTNLLDSYVESCAVQIADTRSQINAIRDYLRRQARHVTHIVMHSADDRLLQRIYGPGFREGHGNPNFQFCLENYDNMSELRHRYHEQEQGIWNDYGDQAFYYETLDNIGSEIHFKKPGAGDDALDAEYELFEDEPDAQFHALYIVHEKWLPVVAMVDAYVRQMKELTGDKAAGLTPDALQEIAELINHTEKKDLPTKLADYLTEYMEQTYA